MIKTDVSLSVRLRTYLLYLHGRKCLFTEIGWYRTGSRKWVVVCQMLGSEEKDDCAGAVLLALAKYSLDRRRYVR